MNKKTTLENLAVLFPDATIRADEDGFSVPLTSDWQNRLSFGVPSELPEGPGGAMMLEGGFQVANSLDVRGHFQTNFMVQVATGYLEGKTFRFGKASGTPQIAVAVRWEGEPPKWTQDGIKSKFAKDYQAIWLERILPEEKGQALSILQQMPPEEMPVGERTGFDFWILRRTDFYRKVCDTRVWEFARMVQLRNAEINRDLCHDMMRRMASEITTDTKLAGWALSCGDGGAHLTMLDRDGVRKEVEVFYTPSFLCGLASHIKRGRSGTLVF